MIVTVEGNIGAGKSTFTKAMVAHLRSLGHTVVHFEEPVGEWTDFYGTNLLDLFYRDKTRWAFAFQVNALRHMADLQAAAVREHDNGNSIVVLERSLFSVVELFNPLVAEYITAFESKILTALCDTVSKSVGRLDSVVMYLRTEPRVCYRRLTGRARPEEVEKIDFKYLTRLHELHEEKLNGGSAFVVDGTSFTKDDPCAALLMGDGSLNAVGTVDHLWATRREAISTGEPNGMED